MNGYGIAGTTAPELKVDEWLANVDADTLRLAEVAEPVIYLYNFQAWCPGCHSHGFPTLAAVKAHFEATDRSHLVKFVAVQTVFEGHDSNTADAAVESLERHGLTDIALGHDAGEPPATMADYGTGGTPWTVVIGPAPERLVLADGFQADPTDAIEIIEEALASIDEPDLTPPTPPTSTDEKDETMTSENTDSTTKPSAEELRERLTPEQFHVTQEAGTERAFTGEYHDTKTEGTYRCVVCDMPLFDSEAKYDSGTGWPSFTEAVDGDNVVRHVDQSHGMIRTEARCASCDAHLGHVFPDGPGETGDRFCMNSASLNLEPAEDAS